jgi:hypothetical protein
LSKENRIVSIPAEKIEIANHREDRDALHRGTEISDQTAGFCFNSLLAVHLQLPFTPRPVREGNFTLLHHYGAWIYATMHGEAYTCDLCPCTRSALELVNSAWGNRLKWAREPT